MSSSIHYNAALAQAARTQWFRNRKDIPIGLEAVTRGPKTNTAEEKRLNKELNSLPQVSLDAQEVYSKSPDARIKWVDKCLKLASMGKLSLQEQFYQLVTNKQFVYNCNEKQSLIIFMKIMRNIKYFSSKQGQFLRSVHFPLYAQHGSTWETEVREKKEQESSSSSDDSDDSDARGGKASKNASARVGREDSDDESSRGRRGRDGAATSSRGGTRDHHQNHTINRETRQENAKSSTSTSKRGGGRDESRDRGNSSRAKAGDSAREAMASSRSQQHDRRRDVDDRRGSSRVDAKQSDKRREDREDRRRDDDRRRHRDEDRRREKREEKKVKKQREESSSSRSRSRSRRRR
ncbi:unnamed protein product [Amoebophrya sp. A25]|nr:unnamed protein product [Amoebophrya sp. A25]|eukprot:GSA25T00005752001.1